MTFYSELETVPTHRTLPLRIDGVSWMNPDMSMTFWVAPEDETSALNALSKADDEWWENDCGLCHHEALCEALFVLHIAFAVSYPEEASPHD